MRWTDFIVDAPLALSAIADPAPSFSTLRKCARSSPRAAAMAELQRRKSRRPVPRRFFRRGSAAMVLLLIH
jgi:hypothetical protein